MSSANWSRRPNLSSSDWARQIGDVSDHARHAHAGLRRAPRAVVVPALPIRIGGDGVARNRIPRDALRLQRVRARDGNDRVDLIAEGHGPFERLHASQRAAGDAAASRVIPSSFRSARSVRTMSATVMTGKSDP